MKRTLLIIDGHNFLFKAFAVPFKFHSKNGTPLHVVTTFLSQLRRMCDAVTCTDLVVVFDAPFKTSNHKLSDAYKTNRKMDYSQDEDSPFNHLPNVKKVLGHLKIKVYEKRGVEADDVIASLSAQYRKNYVGAKVYIASSDSDFYQLLSRDVSLVHLSRNAGGLFFTSKSLKAKYNVTPKQYVLFKSLVGDSTDNIKGVPGIGPLRASKIINKMIKFDYRKVKDILMLNRKLVTLNIELDIVKSKWHLLSFSRQLLQLKNKDIFLKLGL